MRGRAAPPHPGIYRVTPPPACITLHAFLYVPLPLLHDHDVKMPNFTFYGGRKQATTKFSFLFLTLRAVPKKSIPGKLTYTRHFQRIGINVTRFKRKRWFILKVTFSLPLPSSILKLAIAKPSFSPYLKVPSDRKLHLDNCLTPFRE